MAKHLVVCCDGTWNIADQQSKTNVTKVALAVRPHSAVGTEQRVYYGKGVGTLRGERLRGGAFGAGLSRNVLDAYRFLVHTYQPGDQLYLFGFSRGAFTARSLAGLIRNCGIPRPEHADRIGEAWALYRSRANRPTSVAATLFRRAYSYETEIRFIGVWDTVGALGIPALPGPRPFRWLVERFNRRWSFHDTELSSWVNGAFHALAIDEQRSAFAPTLWHQQPGAFAKGQELKQVWFAGVHTDIGGGYPESGLSDITLHWMVDHARAYGLEFEADAFTSGGSDRSTAGRPEPETVDQDPDPTDADDSIEFTVDPSPSGPLHNSRTGLYRLSKPLHRPIGRATDKKTELLDGREYLADTALLRRREEQADYDPPGLDDYLRDFGEQHIERVPLPPD
ncbi:DUF2235 domain-containing protein [Streptomyces sp. NPDC092369]|uniref:DUF2235 domain-containing protein n=1 Tax=Streptomyces sp. NPDC092369 TaxID=3366015 RepID=UPI003800B509